MNNKCLVIVNISEERIRSSLWWSWVVSPEINWKATQKTLLLDRDLYRKKKKAVCDHGGWEVPWFAIGKMETLEMQCCSSSPNTWKPGEYGLNLSLGPKSQQLGTRVCKGRRWMFDPIAILCSILALSKLNNAHFYQWIRPFFLPLLEALLSSRNIFKDTLKIMFYPLCWNPWAKSSQHIKQSATIPYPSHIYQSMNWWGSWIWEMEEK